MRRGEEGGGARLLGDLTLLPHPKLRPRRLMRGTGWNIRRRGMSGKEGGDEERGMSSGRQVMMEWGLIK